jgi:hypothetical protein
MKGEERRRKGEKKRGERGWSEREVFWRVAVWMKRRMLWDREEKRKKS